MQQKRGNKTSSMLTRIVVLTIGVTMLITGTAVALTLDSNVVRNTPFFKRLLITTQGDQTSTSVVELSGTANQLIRILPVMGTSSVLQAPIGWFVKNAQVSGGTFAPGSVGVNSIVTGSIGANSFAFNITTYSIGGGGSVSNGSCPAGEVAVAFSNGSIVCSDAILVSELPVPLCNPGETFLGWLGLGTPACSANIASGFSAGGGELWIATPSNAYNIYYGIASGRSSFGFGSGTVPGTQILVKVQGPQYFNLNFGFPIVPEPCTCSVPFAAYPHCTVYAGGNTPPGYTADSTAQNFLNNLGTGYAFATPYSYYDYNAPYSSGINACSDWFMSGGQTWVNSYVSTGPLVSWSTPAYSGSFVGSEKVGIGLDTPLETLHVSSPSSGMTLSEVTIAGSTGSIYYVPGPLMGSLYAVKLGVLTQGYHCPCDTNPNAADSCGGQTFIRPYPQYNYQFGTHSCYDMDTSNDGYTLYTMNVSFASNLFTLNLSNNGTFNSFGMPRCSCDANSNDGHCQEGQMSTDYPTIPWTPSDGYYFHGPNQGPSCYEVQWGGGSPGYGTGPWGVSKWDKVRDEYIWQFQYIGSGAAAASTNPSCSCDTSSTTVDCTTPIFTGVNPTNTIGYTCNDYTSAPILYNTFSALTGAISSTGTMMYTTGATVTLTTASGGAATMRADDQGTMLDLVLNAENLGAGSVGALSVMYNGANLYVNGGQVGINNSNPQTAFDVAGGVRLVNIANPGYDLLSVNDQGFILATGDVSVFTSQWLNTVTWTGLNSAIQYSPGLTGSVVIGSSSPWTRAWPWLKLYVQGDITANIIRGYSDETLKENITELTGTLAKILDIIGYTYQRQDDGSEDAGLMASEIHGIYPELVENFRHVDVNNHVMIKVINYQALMAAVIEAVQEIHAKLLDAGTERLAEQRADIEKVFRRVEALEAGGRWDGNPGAPINRASYGGG